MELRKLTLEDLEFIVIAEGDDSTPHEMLSECMTSEEIDALIEEAQFNIWKWCSVEVKGTFMGLEASDYLGACSYEDKDDFIKNSGYYADMCQNVLTELQTKIDEIVTILK